MRRKGGFGFDPSNTTEDGHYIVGKGKPPDSGKFKKGDGRRRGRRPKGTRNLATDLCEEFGSSVAVTVGGVAKKVSRQRAIVMRLADNATKGQTSAIALALELQQRLVDPLLGEERQQSAYDKDLKRLSDLELEALIYLAAKVEGVEHSEVSNVVGVLPIFAEGHYISAGLHDEIRRCLSAYHIEAPELPSPSRGCLGESETSFCAKRCDSPL